MLSLPVSLCSFKSAQTAPVKTFIELSVSSNTVNPFTGVGIDDTLLTVEILYP